MCGVIWKKAENGHKYMYGDVVLHIFWFSQGGSFFHETSWAVLCLVLVGTLWCQIVHMGGIKTSGGRFEKPRPK